MHAVLPGLRLPAATFSAALLLAAGRSFYPGTEIADGTAYLSSRRDLLQFSVSSIGSEGNRRGHPRRNISSDRLAKEDDNLKDSTASDDETSRSSSREEIISLFRTIQSSISKGGSSVKNRRRFNKSKENQSTDSVLVSQRQYSAQKQARGSIQVKDEASPHRRVASNKDGVKDDASPTEDFRLSRPALNFVKRSPISWSTSHKEQIDEASEGLPTTVVEEASELQNISSLKLSELKDYAKSKGVKGYSKLKKGELVELLKGMMKSS